ncbi:MAG: hypothetical protein IKD23_05100 [Lentisphaeria bacterium]|nr:hypothetical protein [Lentisphaeria bacterium]
MKKFFLILSTVLSVSVFAAAESEVRGFINDLFCNLRAMNGQTLLAQVTKNYVEIDEEGTKINYDEFADITKAVTNMGKVIDKGLSPQAKLPDILLAVSELEESQIDPATLALAKEIGNTAEGRQLAVNARNALAAMKKIYTDTIDKEMDSLKIVSITVNGDKACAVYRIIRDNKLLQIQLDLVKVNGKWLAEKSSAVKVE